MVRGRKSKLVVSLSTEDRAVLESWQGSQTIPSRLATRGRIILDIVSGNTISDISRAVGIRRRFIYKWVARFEEQGIEGLSDKPFGRVRRTE